MTYRCPVCRKYGPGRPGARYRCLGCEHEWECLAGPLECPGCGHLYLDWLNHEEFAV